MTGASIFVAGLILFTAAWHQAAAANKVANGRGHFAFVTEGLIYGVSFWALVSLLLVRLGVFSSPLVSVILLAAGGMWLGAGRLAGLPSERRLPAVDDSHSRLFNTLGVILIVAASIYYALLPTYYLLGGRDPGNYLNFAAHIAHTGGLHFYDPMLAGLKDVLGEGLRLGYPAFYSAYERGLSKDMGEIIPQFMHLFPAAAAHFFSWFGIEGLVRANSFLGGVAALAVFATARLLFGSKAALLALFLLVVNPAYIWASRITLTEVLSVLIIFAGLYALVMAVRAESPSWGALAGALLGATVLNRLDGAFGVVAVCGICLYAPIFNKRLVKTALTVLIAYTTFFFLGWADAYLHSYPQLYDLWNLGQADKLLYMNLIAIPGCIGFLWLGGRLRQIDETTLRAMASWLPTLAVISLLFLFAFFYDFRPKRNLSFNGRAMVELCWYITPAMPVLAILGVGYLTKERLDRFSLGEWLPAALFIFGTTAVYTWRPSIHSDHIWATRRWVPYAIPGLTLLGAYGFLRLAGSYLRPRYVGVLAVALGAYYTLNASLLALPFSTRSMLESYPASYAEIVRRLPENSLLLVRDYYGQIPSVLKWVYHRDAYIADWEKIYPDSVVELMRRYPERPIFIAGELKGFPSSDKIGLEELPGLILLGDYPEVVRGTFARRLYQRWYRYPIFRLNSSGNLKLNAGGNVFNTRVGMKVDDEMFSQGSAGNLVFGPYIPMTEGRYRILWKGEVLDRDSLCESVEDSSNRIAHADVVADLGATDLGLKPIFASDLVSCAVDESRDGSAFEVSLPVLLKKRYEDVEFRFYLDKPLDLKLREVFVERMPGAE